MKPMIVRLACFPMDGKQVGLVSRGDAVPVHIYACLTSVEACIRFFRGDLNDGDVILACDPFFGGTHIGDYTIILPVFCNNKPVFFASVRAHMLDVGGPVPGGLMPRPRKSGRKAFAFLRSRCLKRANGGGTSGIC